MIEHTHFEEESEPVGELALRNFALVWVLIGIVWCFWAGLDHIAVPYVLIVAVILIIVSMGMPSILRLPYQGWMFFGVKLSWVMSRVILFVVFFGALTPLAIIRRLFSKKQETITSYWHNDRSA